MKSHNRKLPAAQYLFPWLRHLIDLGYDIEPSMKKVGLQYSDLFAKQYPITPENHITMVEEMEKLVGRPDLIRECLGKLDISDHGMLGVLVLCGLTLKHSILALMRFQYLRTRSVHLSFHEEGDFAIIRAEVSRDLKQAELFMMEITLRSILKSKQTLIGHMGYEDSLHFKSARPAEDHEMYHGMREDSFKFDQEHYQLVFPRVHLYTQLSKANQKSFQILEERCNECLEMLNDELNLIEKVEYLLRNCESRFPSVDDMAHILKYSPRSLSRHLQQADTNYKYLIDAERVRRVKNMLLESPSINLTDIAMRLYFTDSSHLTKVFKRHSGISPSQFRSTIKYPDNTVTAPPINTTSAHSDTATGAGV